MCTVPWLINFQKNTNNYNCKLLLLSLYEYGKSQNKNQLTVEEIKTVFENNKDVLLQFLKTFAVRFQPQSSLLLLKYRSALEFLFGFNRPCSKLKKVFQDTLQELDDSVAFLKNHMYDGVEPEGYSYEELLKPRDIPSTHTWWFISET